MPKDSAARETERRMHAAPAPKDEEKGSQRRANASIASGDRPLWMDLDFVRGLIEAVDQSTIDTLEMYREGIRIRISKSPPQTRASSNGVTAPPVPPPGTPPPSPPQTTADEPPQRNWTDITSPMVGTFYRAPAPEAPAYVEVGSMVRKGQTLCILEAMKLMNELESEVDGVVREILAENADPVEYGQVLFRIEPGGSA
jgi:acetyl-CoA carboxylase biotin carboxyl carrier protein